VFVVDASVLVSILAGAEHAGWAQEQLETPGPRRSLWAPHLIDAEVGHSLRRRVAARQLDADDALEAIDDLIRLPLRRIAHRDLLDRAWALRDNLSFYDALYIALAERLEFPLLTLDDRLTNAVGACKEIGVAVVSSP
jgi:predicted nucleic acid-binding protein